MTNELPNLPGNQDKSIENHREIEIKQSNKVLYLSIGLVIVLIVALFTNGFGIIKSPTGKVIDNPTGLSIGNSPYLGNISAPVTIYEFSDFSCPYCAAADGEQQQYINALKYGNPNWEAPIPNIIKDYVETGKAKIVFKYYPGHGSGKPALVVGYALADQSDDLFWKFHNLAFQNQANTGDLVKMKALAESLGANMTRLNADIESGKYESQMNEDIATGKTAGIKGTPSFIINGEVVVGAQSYSAFKQVIDKALK